MWILRVFPLVALLLSITVSADAQASDEARREEARALFDAGRLAFEDGRYEDAHDLFARANAIFPMADLLYNTGLAAERALRLEAAAEAYQGYLDEYPDGNARAEVERRLNRLRSRLAEATLPEEEPERPERPDESSPAPVDIEPHAPPPPPERLMPVGGWALLIGGAAAVVLGGVLVGVAIADRDTVQGVPDGGSWSDIEGAHGRVLPLSTAGFITLGVGTALALSGAIWLAVGEEGEVSVGPGGVAWRGHFE